MVIQTQRLRLIDVSTIPYNLIFKAWPGIELKLERVLVLILFSPIPAYNFCYQRDIMLTTSGRRLWMGLPAPTEKRLVVPTQHSRLSSPLNTNQPNLSPPFSPPIQITPLSRHLLPFTPQPQPL